MRLTATFALLAVLTLGACGGSAETGEAGDPTAPTTAPPEPTTALTEPTFEGPTETTAAPPTTTPPQLPPPADVDALTVRDACLDVVWFARSEDLSALLTIDTPIDEPRDDAAQPDVKGGIEFNFAEGEATAKLEYGEFLDTCTDLIILERRVDETYTAVRGTASVEMGERSPVNLQRAGTITLTNVVLANEAGDEVSIPDMTWETNSIGMTPG